MPVIQNMNIRKGLDAIGFGHKAHEMSEDEGFARLGSAFQSASKGNARVVQTPAEYKKGKRVPKGMKITYRAK